MRRAALNDGWLGLPATVDDNLALVRTMHRIRAEHGLPLDGWRPCVSLCEPITADAELRLAEGGAHDVVVMPWIPNPWEGEQFVPAGADIGSLAVKKLSMARFADRIIHRAS